MWESVYFLLLAFSVGFNLLLYVVAYLLQTDKITDISYSLTFAIITVVGYFYFASDAIDGLIAFLVLIWALRLGSYLFIRILKIGHDERFDQIRVNPLSFFAFWLMQGLTCALVSFPTIAIFKLEASQVNIVFVLMVILSLSGLLLETIADAQKFKFKNSFPKKFMHSGVWKKIRHPNYTGELMFWWGLFFAGLSLGIHWGTIVGPLWMSLIILRFSGVPILVKKWELTYGNLEEFQEYKKNSWILIPYVY